MFCCCGHFFGRIRLYFAYWSSRSLVSLLLYCFSLSLVSYLSFQSASKFNRSQNLKPSSDMTLLTSSFWLSFSILPLHSPTSFTQPVLKSKRIPLSASSSSSDRSPVSPLSSSSLHLPDPCQAMPGPGTTKVAYFAGSCRVQSANRTLENVTAKTYCAFHIVFLKKKILKFKWFS